MSRRVGTGFLAATGLATHHDDAYLLSRHHWRFQHQTRATVSHYNRHGDPPSRTPPTLAAH